MWALGSWPGAGFIGPVGLPLSLQTNRRRDRTAEARTSQRAGRSQRAGTRRAAARLLALRRCRRRLHHPRPSSSPTRRRYSSHRRASSTRRGCARRRASRLPWRCRTQTRRARRRRRRRRPAARAARRRGVACRARSTQRTPATPSQAPRRGAVTPHHDAPVRYKCPRGGE